MISQLPPRHQLGLFAIGAMALVSMSYIGGTYLRRPADIVVTQEKPPSTPVAVDAFAEPAPEAPPTELLVHVAGAVKSPKVVRLKPNARVQDAIAAAGGALPDADLELSLNMAAKVQDGDKILVRRKSEGALPVVETTSSLADPSVVKATSSPTSSEKKSPTGGGIVSLNTSTQAQLETLPGVGPSTAQKILQYRQEHGGFGSIDELLAVKGIGPKKLAAMRKHLRL